MGPNDCEMVHEEMISVFFKLTSRPMRLKPSTRATRQTMDHGGGARAKPVIKEDGADVKTIRLSN